MVYPFFFPCNEMLTLLGLFRIALQLEDVLLGKRVIYTRVCVYT